MRASSFLAALILLPACAFLFGSDDDNKGGDNPTCILDCDTSSGDASDNDGDGWKYDDCDDNDPDVNPEADEICDGIDNDCDGHTDNDAKDATRWYDDADGDGWGDGGDKMACDEPDGMTADDGDCDDGDPAYHPGADESDCEDPNDYDCDGHVDYEDADNDGYAACADCDDEDRKVHTRTTETCNGKDDDCDGTVDEPDTDDCEILYEDADEDGFGGDSVVCACPGTDGYSDVDGDCNDAIADVNPDAKETCATTYDDDCDGRSNDWTGGVAPVANAGVDISDSAGTATCAPAGYVYACNECADVVLTLGTDATATDADGDSVTTMWTVTSGSATIDDPTSLSTDVTLTGAAPSEPGACEEIDYVFTLTATDCSGKSSSNTVTVTVDCCGVEDTSE